MPLSRRRGEGGEAPVNVPLRERLIFFSPKGGVFPVFFFYYTVSKSTQGFAGEAPIFLSFLVL